MSVIVLFALIGEAGILVPTLASFHKNWLQTGVNAAQIAALALEAAPDQAITESLRHELLENAAFGVWRSSGRARVNFARCDERRR
ncbi:MAG: hypothetical protein WDN76_06885 [Alphaproteobacteria bacterium]